MSKPQRTLRSISDELNKSSQPSRNGAPERIQQLPGMHLHFRSYGQGPQLIILHGLFGSLDNWHAMSERLSSRFQVFAVDQRNHGQSPHSSEMDYKLMARDLAEFMQTHHLAEAHILGHSMGGKTAMQFAFLYPGYVRRLVVVDIAPRAYAPRHKQILEAMLSLGLAHFTDRKQIEKALEPQIPELALRRFLIKSVARLPSGGFGWKLNLAGINNNYEKLNAELTWDQVFDKPTLFIRGEKSDYIRESDVALIQRLFRAAEFRTIKGAGHWVHADAPEVFVSVVLDFLTDK